MAAGWVTRSVPNRARIVPESCQVSQPHNVVAASLRGAGGGLPEGGIQLLGGGMEYLVLLPAVPGVEVG